MGPKYHVACLIMDGGIGMGGAIVEELGEHGHGGLSAMCLLGG